MFRICVLWTVYLIIKTIYALSIRPEFDN